jgi:hypothetical protein
MTYWLFNIGTGQFAPPEDWFIAAEWSHHQTEMWFPPNKKPTGVSVRDRAVINGSKRRGILAAVEIVSTEPELNTTGNLEERLRWPWKVRHRLLVAKSADERHAATLEAAGISPLSTRHQPHIRLQPVQYHAAVDALLRAAGDAAR